MSRKEKLSSPSLNFLLGMELLILFEFSNEKGGNPTASSVPSFNQNVIALFIDELDSLSMIGGSRNPYGSIVLVFPQRDPAD